MAATMISLVYYFFLALVETVPIAKDSSSLKVDKNSSQQRSVSSLQLPMELFKGHMNLRIIDTEEEEEIQEYSDYFEEVLEARDDSFESDKWLEDLETEYSERSHHANSDDKTPSGSDFMQADSPGQGMPLCPPPPQLALPKHSCHSIPCKSDKECEKDLGCCFNGCVYTCLLSIEPPAYLDWIKQPIRRLVSGSSWLIEGPQQPEIELCSASEESYTDSDPLLCPHGYTCFLDEKETDDADGPPARGRCVPEYPQLPTNDNNNNDNRF